MKNQLLLHVKPNSRRSNVSSKFCQQQNRGKGHNKNKLLVSLAEFCLHLCEVLVYCYPYVLDIVVCPRFAREREKKCPESLAQAFGNQNDVTKTCDRPVGMQLTIAKDSKGFDPRSGRALPKGI
jgi:hypothetical protein